MGNSQITYSKTHGNEDTKEETPVYRSAWLEEGEDLIDSCGNGEIQDLKTLLQHSFDKFAENPCLGSMEEEKKEYKFKTYKECHELSKNLAKALIDEEMCPKIKMSDSGEDALTANEEVNEANKEFRIMGIYAKNREEWAFTDFACIQAAVTSIPLYDTIGKKSIEFIIDQTGLITIACTEDKIENILKLKKDSKVKTLKFIITLDKCSEKTEKECEEADLKLWNIYDLVKKGEESETTLDDPKPDSLFTICYTSGTTGDPKGVLVTHKNVCSTLGGVERFNVVMNEDDVHYSFLPLAHVFERLFYICMIKAGGRVGYYRGDTRKIKEDISILKPTIFAAVPRLLNKFYDKMQENLQEQSIFKRGLVSWALWAKTSKIDSSGDFNHMVYDKYVFDKFREVLGGRVRMIITGSAPISKEVIRFLKAAFSCELYEAYGQTETGGASFATSPYDPVLGHVGGPGPHNEFKLVDCKDLGYTAEDEVDGKKTPRGELCVRGPSVFPGYFKLADKTKETIDEDGWVHSGDIAMILENGAIKIIDRKKNLFKLNQGEYIAAEKLEGAYEDIDCISQIFIYGDSLQHYLVAVVVPDEDAAKKVADKEGIKGDDFEEMMNSDEFHEYLIKQMKSIKESEGFNSYEVPEKVFCTKEEFTEENGLMTPTHKVKRNEVKKKFIDEIKEMYDGAKLQGDE